MLWFEMCTTKSKKYDDIIAKMIVMKIIDDNIALKIFMASTKKTW